MKCDNSMNWQICKGKSLLNTENKLLIEYFGCIFKILRAKHQIALSKCIFTKGSSFKMSNRSNVLINGDIFGRGLSKVSFGISIL